MTRREYQLQAFDRLLTVMDELRSQCPWDQKQTMETLRPLTIEETYELADAILDQNTEEIKGELGDLLLHIVFYSKIGSETNDFDIAKVKNEEEVKQNWEKIKLKEGKKSVLEGVPNSLPALVKASRIQDKVAGVGFDWEMPEQVLEKVEEELQEFKTEIDQNNTDAMESEFGDVLFSLINYARFLKINPENALERTNKKFVKRFQYLENQAQLKQRTLSSMTLAEMDVLWEEAKSQQSNE